LDPQLSAKFQQKFQNLNRKWNQEHGKRNIELASRGSLRSGIALQANREAIAENMREMIEELINVAKQHQELRQIRYTNKELKAIEESISLWLEGYLSETQRGFEASMANQGMTKPDYLNMTKKRFALIQTECISSLKTSLGDLKLYKPPDSPEIVVNIVNNINIDMDVVLREMIQKIAASKCENETEKTKLKKLLESLRKSTMIKEIGKTVIQESIRFAAKSAMGV
jgi:hypothetical protein